MINHPDTTMVILLPEGTGADQCTCLDGEHRDPDCVQHPTGGDTR